MAQIFDFMGLPRELRDKVYTLTGEWNNVRRIPVPTTTPPPVLLLSRQTNVEARQALARKPLALNKTSMLPHIMDRTLKTVVHLVIEAAESKDSASELNFVLEFQGYWTRQSTRLQTIQYRVGGTVYGGQTTRADVCISMRTSTQP